MEWKDLAPWIAIAITLILSILVPLFTQIANNCHQRKLQKEKFEYEAKQKKIRAFETFLVDVGGTITARGHIEKEALSKAGSAVHQLYIYVPVEWYSDLDLLTEYISKFEWEDAMLLNQEICRKISDELKNH